MFRRSIPADSAVEVIFDRGPTKIGTIRPCRAASTAPDREAASQGCATAVGMGSRAEHLVNSCSYFPVPGCGNCTTLATLCLLFCFRERSLGLETRLFE